MLKRGENKKKKDASLVKERPNDSEMDVNKLHTQGQMGPVMPRFFSEPVDYLTTLIQAYKTQQTADRPALSSSPHQRSATKHESSNRILRAGLF